MHFHWLVKIYNTWRLNIISLLVATSKRISTVCIIHGDEKDDGGIMFTTLDNIYSLISVDNTSNVIAFAAPMKKLKKNDCVLAYNRMTF